jgi:hypothetical protein
MSSQQGEKKTPRKYKINNVFFFFFYGDKVKEGPMLVGVFMEVAGPTC